LGFWGGGGRGGLWVTRKTETTVVAYLGSSNTNYTIFVKMFEKFKKKILLKE
jgi:hypothetical protein